MEDNVYSIQEATEAALDVITPLGFASLLGVHNSHIYRARNGDYTNTYVCALRSNGIVPPREKRIRVCADVESEEDRELLYWLVEGLGYESFGHYVREMVSVARQASLQARGS